MEYLTAALIGAAAGFAVGATIAWFRRRRIGRNQDAGSDKDES